MREITLVSLEDKTFVCLLFQYINIFQYLNNDINFELNDNYLFQGEKPYHCTMPNCKWRFARSDELVSK
jgi:hypothetical protein